MTRIIRKRNKLGQFTKNSSWSDFVFILATKQVAFKLTTLALMVSLNGLAISNIGYTTAFFNDTETSNANTFTADSLDFALSSYEFESFIGLGEIVSKNTVIVNSGGMDFQYNLETEEVSDLDGLCDALNLQAKLNGVEQYDGDLMSLDTSASTTLGTWKFNIELPVDEDSFTNGEECQFDVVFKGWQTNIASYDDGGFTDEERMNFTITAGQIVVLNEFLPRPDGVAYDFDFGNDSSDMPQGEWVELYNNSTEPIDVAGWYTKDVTDGGGNKVVITALNTSPATTIIPGKGWLVVYMNKAIFNNTGDTVRLFDDEDILIDSHVYVDNDFCEIEPTPGDENSDDASGACAGVPPNKSYARIPDGIGDWVDPIPTPGNVNRPDEVEETATLQNNNSLSGTLSGNGLVLTEEIEIVAPEPEVIISTEPIPEETEETPVVEEPVVPEVVTEVLEVIETLIIPVTTVGEILLEAVEPTADFASSFVEPMPEPAPAEPQA